MSIPKQSLEKAMISKEVRKNPESLVSARIAPKLELGVFGLYLGLSTDPIICGKTESGLGWGLPPDTMGSGWALADTAAALA